VTTHGDAVGPASAATPAPDPQEDDVKAAPAANDEARLTPAPSLGEVVATAKAPPLPPVAVPSVEPVVAAVTPTVTEATSTVGTTVDDVGGLLPSK